MKRISTLFMVGLLSTSLGGCFIVSKKPERRSSAISKRDRCHPSQYWDGSQCRHKGKGHGARKHDGRRK